MREDDELKALSATLVLDKKTGEVFEWPNCETPDCPNKQCTWGGLPLCHPCSVRVVGRAEMDRRYEATH